MTYQRPNFKKQYENYIGGQWTAPVDGQYFDNTSPVDGSFIAKVPQSNGKDIDLAVKAAWKDAATWNKTSVTERCNLINKIADRIEENLENLAIVETWDNGKAIRETMAADLPLAIDHFRYFASIIRAETGEVSEIVRPSQSNQRLHDQRRYVKVFRESLRDANNLPLPSFKLWNYILQLLEPKRDKFDIVVADAIDFCGWKSRVMYYKAIVPLLEAGFIARRTGNYQSFFINPDMAFNGDRTAIYTK